MGKGVLSCVPILLGCSAAWRPVTWHEEEGRIQVRTEAGGVRIDPATGDVEEAEVREPPRPEWSSERLPAWVRPMRDLPTLRFGRTRFALLTGPTITFGVVEAKALRALGQIELPGVPLEFHFNAGDAILVETTLGVWHLDLGTGARERLRGAAYSPWLYYDRARRTLVLFAGGRVRLLREDDLVYARPP